MCTSVVTTIGFKAPSPSGAGGFCHIGVVRHVIEENGNSRTDCLFD